MIPDNFNNLLKKLSDKTEKRQMIWTKTSRDNEFKVFLEKGAVTIDNWRDDDDSFVDIGVYNDRGDQIDRVTFAEQQKSEYEAVLKVHEKAKRAYFKVDDTFREIFKELDSDKTIGAKPDNSTDDLPF